MAGCVSYVWRGVALEVEDDGQGSGPAALGDVYERTPVVGDMTAGRAEMRRMERDRVDRETKIARVIEHAFKHPWRGDTPLTCPLHNLHLPAITEPGRPTNVLCSFDQHYHGSGWFKNSDYEQCLHVSVSHRGEGYELRHVPAELGGGTTYAEKLETPSDAELWAWAVAFFGAHAQMAWLEPPCSPLDPYRMPNIGHLRLYYEVGTMRPFMPQGEVYDLKPLAGLSPAKIIEGAAGGDVR